MRQAERSTNNNFPGAAGFLFGGTAGIIKGTAPFLFASASGLQTFALGTTFWGCRTTILEAWNPDQQTSSDLVKASAIAGGITGGAVALITRGRSNAIPGALMFSLFGYLGQKGYNKLKQPREAKDEPKQGFWRRMSEKRFSPVTVMTDEEYAKMLEEKMLKVDVEIAVLREKVAALKEQQEQQEQPAPDPTPPAK